MNAKLLKEAAAIAVGYMLIDWLLDTYVIKSDTADPRGLVLATPGFGLDDVVRAAAVGLGTAVTLKVARKVVG